jgi:hypothetical protein
MQIAVADSGVWPVDRPRVMLLRAGHLSAVVAIMLMLPSVASAECAGPSRICDAFERAKIVALADVIHVSSQSPRTHLRILELFKGDGEAEVQFNGGNIEDFQYAVGQRVIVYLHVARFGLESTCSRSKLAVDADSEIAALRALRDRQIGSWTYGELWAPVKPGMSFSLYPESVSITVRLRDRVIGRIRTDQRGHFELGWLTPGKYTIEVRDSRFGRGTTHVIEVTGTSKCLSLSPIQLSPP